MKQIMTSLCYNGDMRMGKIIFTNYVQPFILQVFSTFLILQLT